jgi:hypothetical protein
VDDIKLVFDGSEIDDDETPKSLELENDDLIDVKVRFESLIFESCI